MATAHACPDLAQYQQLAAGNLADVDAESLLEHLGRCDPCVQKLNTLAEQHSRVEFMRRDHARRGGTDDEAIRRLVERLSTLRPGEAPIAATASYHPARRPARELYDFLTPPQAPDEIGRLGEYRVLKVLGAGGMGVVFQAQDPKLERTVALKAMLPALAVSATARQRFLREAQTAAAIEHEHIVRIFQVGEDRGVPFIAMPFLKGEPLDERLQRERVLPVAEVLRIGKEMALGLSAAHAAGLIHRDIKPANLWLETVPAEPGLSTPGFRVKILDFGLARAAADNSQLTQQGAIVGTPAYMAPEQARGQALDTRCDLFSLGCVLYRMSTGTAPFKGTDAVSTLISVTMHNPPSPLELRPELPPALSDLVMKLLAKKREERPQSAQVVTEALDDIEIQKTTSAARVEQKVPRNKRGGGAWMDAARTLLYRPPRKRPRWPWLVGVAGVPLAVVIAGIMLFWPAPRGVVKIESDEIQVSADGQVIGAKALAAVAAARLSPGGPLPKTFTNSVGMELR